MIKNNNKKYISESEIINKYLSKLNFKKKESFNFKNDGAQIKYKKNHNLLVTNDTIVESIDFFKSDKADSIAQKIVTYNLSDLSAMGSIPYAYTLSLSLPKGISKNWISSFTKRLFFLQKKYNFFLLGGDISQSDQIHISANFYGYVKNNLIIKREFPKIGDSIWVTGNIGESYIGLLLKQKKININMQFNKYFINKYLYPNPCMIGSQINKMVNSAIDISDGLLGDLSKLLNNKIGANLFLSKIPFSPKLKILINKMSLDYKNLLTCGDDYELIFTSSKTMDKKITNLAKKNKYKISKVGTIIDKKGLFIDGKKVLNLNNSFQYFF